MITVRAAVYDALEAMCELTGGIGHGSTWRNEMPFCLWGHIAAAGLTEDLFPFGSYHSTDDLSNAEREIFPLGGFDADDLVANALGPWNFWGRVSWKRFCYLAGVVRGS